MNKFQRLLAFTLLLSMEVTHGQGRVSLNLNSNWAYLESPLETLREVRKAENWENIDLPHTWNYEDVMDLIPGYRRSTSWYKKNLSIDNATPENRQILYFEGVNITTEVFVNGNHAGTHVGGYLGFEIEITKWIKNGENEIFVKVDNGYDKQIIPSQKSDFFIYGGITRDVWLWTVGKSYVTDVNISTANQSNSSTDVNIQVELDGDLKKNLMAVLKVFDRKGKAIHEAKQEAKTDLSFKFAVSDPMLWDTQNPNLYRVSVSLLDDKSGRILDEVKEKFGIRWFEFKKNGPFYLNGERLLLRGTHRHEEHAGVGAAMSNTQHRQDMEMIKEMGANFVRLAHYPQDPEIYRACDELGILVWDELPWCRGGLGGEEWKTNTTNMFQEMVDQNFNHPSIIIWSLGNEIYWLPDFEGGGDEMTINTYLNELNDLSHKLDPSRKTAIRKYYPGADIVDVFSPSIWSGWYSGSYNNYKKVVDQSIQKYDHFFHMEYGGSSHVGRHLENPVNGDGIVNPDDWEEEVNQLGAKNIANSGDWSESYIVDLFDWYLHVSENHDQLIGNAQWAFKDFGTPLRPENDIPYLNQKGLMDRAGNPKDAYYVFKSYWAEEPFVYIESHTWTERAGPKGQPRNVCVFSNNEEVELFQNGQSLGRKKRSLDEFPACGLNWDVNFISGENELYGVGYKNNKETAEDELTVNYTHQKAGKPKALELSYEKKEDGNYLVTVTARDAQGLRSLNYEERVYFQCLAGGELVKNLGTPTGSESIKMANGRANIIVKPYEFASKLQVTVLNQFFKGSFIEIDLTL